jgi:hypothetical protein
MVPRIQTIKRPEAVVISQSIATLNGKLSTIIVAWTEKRFDRRILDDCKICLQQNAS